MNKERVMVFLLLMLGAIFLFGSLETATALSSKPLAFGVNVGSNLEILEYPEGTSVTKSSLTVING